MRDNILLIDSVHVEFVAALITKKETYLKVHHEQRSHDKNLNILVQELLMDAGLDFVDLDAYAVVTGPGSWTGCRVGVTAVKAYCVAVPRPVITLNSLDVIGDPSALRSNLDKYYVKRGEQYTYEKLDSLKGFMTLDTISTEQYRKNLISATIIKYAASVFTDVKAVQPFYIAEFDTKS